jgi:hypothetical protein
MRRALLIAVCVLAGIVVPALSAAAQVTTATFHGIVGSGESPDTVTVSWSSPSAST